MNQDRLFQQTRFRLAGWYAGVMGVILSFCGLGVYEAIAHAHWMTLDREVSSVAGTLHDSLTPFLKLSSRLEPDLKRLLPDLCWVSAKEEIACEESRDLEPQNPQAIGAIHQGKYYVRFIDLSGNAIAVAGRMPSELPPAPLTERWQTLIDSSGTRYRQISLLLHTRDRQKWGYLQVGRSLRDFQDYLALVKLIMIVGLPMALLFVAMASWGLAGLAMQPIFQSYQQIQQFTADAAHELRTPLAAIRATVESTLRMKQLSKAEALETLKIVDRQNHRLSQLVNDLLWLSRMDRQVLPSSRETCCLNDIISDVEEEVAALAIAADVTLTTEIRVKDLLQVKGREEQLYRLVFNLVSNAIQYTERGGKVMVILKRENTQAVIQVADTGIGIAATDLPRIFDRFYRVNSDRSRHSGGSGLGLAIARAIAATHSGSIQVQSELGKGSVFILYLPAID
jgi:two-component system OmpR family sensor kinase